MASQQQASNTPKESRDRWRTPPFVFHWANQRFDFNIDLACNHKNKLCKHGLTEKEDSLSVNWHIFGDQGWLNMPYSKPGPWLEKSYDESTKGMLVVCLCPTPNGEDQYRDHVFSKASEVIFINGRLSFLADCDFTVKGKNGKPDKHYKEGDPVPGNTRGSCLIVYRPHFNGHTQMYDVNRDDMQAEYEVYLLEQAKYAAA